jgi:hypothetical protein
VGVLVGVFVKVGVLVKVGVFVGEAVGVGVVNTQVVIDIIIPFSI